MPFNNGLDNPGDLLDNFDFAQFLETNDAGEFTFDPSTFDTNEGIEAGMPGGV